MSFHTQIKNVQMHEMMRKMMQENVGPFILRQQKIEKNQLALYKQQQLSIEKNKHIVSMLDDTKKMLDDTQRKVNDIYLHIAALSRRVGENEKESRNNEHLNQQLDALLAMTNHPDTTMH